MSLRARLVVPIVAGALLAVPAGRPAEAGLLDPLLGTVVGVVSTALDTTSGLLTGASWGYAPSQTPMSLVASSVGADRMWSRGYTGAGVGVALIDTGAVPVQGLDAAGRVVNGPDLSFESQRTQLRNLDGFGHGTHLAGIIAGNDGTATGFKGVAPGSTLLNVRVGASSGEADVSQVVAAIDWVVAHRNDPGLNVRVLNLAYGTNGTQATTTDPLTHAVENAWRAGIVVVVAGGNKGSNQPSLDNPARDPYVLAVGAADPKGTPSALDDTVPDFSSRGSSARRVDLVAPGQSIVSLRDPGSYIDVQYPGARVETRFTKGSGTSQAAAVVSGAAALLLQQRPSLTPDQVKALLKGTATPLLLTSTSAMGSGLIDVNAASLAAVPSTTQSWTRSTGTGTLAASRGSLVLNDGKSDLVGEKDVFGTAWSASTWAAKSSAGTSWTGGTFNGKTWSGSCWCGTSWTSKTWGSVTWTQTSWGGVTWSSRSWSDQQWSSRSWSGTGWTARSWSARSWSASSWA